MAATDDEIICKRLLIEGDGGNDDRRITTLLKNYIKYCNSTDKEEQNTLYNNIMAGLAGVELAMQKATNVYHMNLQEQKNYQQLTQQIEERIEAGLEQITVSKQDLQHAKRIRKNKQEYDTLAKVIQQHPDRLTSLKQLEKLDNELLALQAKKDSLNEKLELRKKQCHALVMAIHEMQYVLDDEQKSEALSTDSKSMDTT